MTGTGTGFHGKANGAFFPLVHGMELRRDLGVHPIAWPGNALRWFRGPTWSCAEWGMALVGRAVALAPHDQRRREALRQDAHVLAALVRECEILKRDAIDRILNAGVAFGTADSAIGEILNSEFMA